MCNVEILMAFIRKDGGSDEKAFYTGHKQFYIYQRDLPMRTALIFCCKSLISVYHGRVLFMRARLFCLHGSMEGI